MTLLSIRPGTIFKLDGRPVRIERVADFDTVVVIDDKQGVHRVPIVDILRAQEDKASPKRKLDPRRLAKVDRYATALAPILDPARRTSPLIRNAADALGVSVSSVYRALSRFDVSGTIDDLPPPTRSGGKGKPRIEPEAEKAIQHLLKTQHPGPTAIARSVFIRKAARVLQEKGLTVSIGTIRARLKSYDPGPPRNSRRARRQGVRWSRNFGQGVKLIPT